MEKSLSVSAKERTRECNDPETQYGGIPCHGDDIQIINCNKLNCPIDGNWGTWSSWHGCSVSCGGGTQTSTRQCNNPPALYGGQQCPGDNERSQDCNDHSCPSNIQLKYQERFNYVKPCLDLVQL